VTSDREAGRRLPAHFLQGYLSPACEDARQSGLPADLARRLDRERPLELSGTLLHCMNPEPLANQVGHVITSIIPAALDRLLRAPGDSYFLNMFALFAIGATPVSLAPGAPMQAQLRRLIVDALIDHFEGVSQTFGIRGTEGLEDEVAAIVEQCAPELRLFPVRFHFAAGGEPPGARLMAYLFDERPPSFAPAPWPARIDL
jgi:hypothetical protein